MGGIPGHPDPPGKLVSGNFRKTNPEERKNFDKAGFDSKLRFRFVLPSVVAKEKCNQKTVVRKLPDGNPDERKNLANVLGWNPLRFRFV